MNNQLETFGSIIQVANDFATRNKMSVFHDTYDGANDYILRWQSNNGLDCSIVISDLRVPSEGLRLQPFAKLPEKSILSGFYYVGMPNRIFPNISTNLSSKLLDDARIWAIDKPKINYTKSDNSSLSPILRALKDRNPRQRYVAAMTLMRVQDASIVEPLIDALDDMDARVVSFAINALGRVGNACAVQPLIKLLKVGNQGHRVLAAKSLGLIKDVSAEPLLILAMKDEDAEVRLSAIEALGNVGSLSTTGPLVEAFKSGDEPTQIASAKALGRVADSNVIQILLQQQKYSCEPLRETITQSINFIKDRANSSHNAI